MEKQKILKYISLLSFVGILLLGFNLRVRAVLDTEVIFPIRADAEQYMMYAYNLQHYQVYSNSTIGYTDQHSPPPDALRHPGYPLFLTLFVTDTINQRTLLNILLVQALLSTLSIWLIYAFSRSFLTIWAALFVALLTALSPHLVNANVYVLTEALFSFSLVLFIWLVSRIIQSTRLSLWLLCGITIGVTTLIRPSLQYFIVPLALLAFFHFGKLQGAKVAILITLGFILVLSPWWLRNFNTLGYVSDDRLKISTLHYGIYPDLKFQDDDRTYGFPYRYDPRTPEIGRSVSTVVTEIKNRFVTEPTRYFYWYFIGKPISFWSWNTIQRNIFIYEVSKSPYFDNRLFKITYNLMYGLHWPLVILSMLGCALVWIPKVMKTFNQTQRWVLWVLSLVLLYFVGLHIIGAPFPRYSVPIRPLLFAMSVFTLWFLGTIIIKFVHK